MPLYLMIISSIGIAICIYGIISKIIEITTEKTIEKYIHKNQAK